MPCAGAVVHDGQGRLLLVRRRNPPAAGSWSLPGGRVEPGEESAAAAVREVAEETGLRVRSVRLLGRVERDGPGGVRYVIDDWLCTAVGGVLAAGDDASDVQYVTGAELAALTVSDGLVEALAGWSVLPH